MQCYVQKKGETLKKRILPITEVFRFVSLSETLSIYNKKNKSHLAEYTTGNVTTAEELLFSEKYLYLIRSESSLTKIGISKNPKRRLREIKLSGYNAHILALFMPEPTIDIAANYLEKILHKFFKEKRKFGEWFDLNNDDIENITETLEDMCTFCT